MAYTGAARPANWNVARFAQFEQVLKARIPVDGEPGTRKRDARSFAGRTRRSMRRRPLLVDPRRRRSPGTEDLGVEPARWDAQARKTPRQVLQESSGAAQVEIRLRRYAKAGQHVQSRCPRASKSPPELPRPMLDCKRCICNFEEAAATAHCTHGRKDAPRPLRAPYNHQTSRVELAATSVVQHRQNRSHPDAGTEQHRRPLVRSQSECASVVHSLPDNLRHGYGSRK